MMSDYSGGPRPLSWELSRPLVQSRTTEDDGDCEPSSFVWPEDSDERVPIVFMLSLNEYNVLASAIDVGGDIAYGEDAIRVNWLWMRNMRCNVDLCDLIVQCIQNNPATLQAIIDGLTGSAEFGDYIDGRSASVNASAVGRSLGQIEDCDPDLLFNAVSETVALLNTATTDFFQIVESGTNVFESVQIMFSAIPILGQAIPVDEAAAAVDQIIETVDEAYAAAYTQTLFDEIRCDIFCLVRDDCDLSLARLITYYEEKVSTSLPDDPIEFLVAIFNTVGNGGLGGAQIVYASHLLVLAMVRLGASVTGIDFGRLASNFLSAGSVPDNDWETLCDCAPVYWQVIDFPSYQTGTIISQTSTRVEAASQISFDNRYRVVIGLVSEFLCATVTAPPVNVEFPGKIRCGETGVDFTPIVIGDQIGRVSYASDSPFTVVMEYTL